jgi:hypothetical protein
LSGRDLIQPKSGGDSQKRLMKGTSGTGTLTNTSGLLQHSGLVLTGLSNPASEVFMPTTYTTNYVDAESTVSNYVSLADLRTKNG